MPAAVVIPVLAVPDVAIAIDWCREAFGFTLRLRIADHRAQLNVGDGAIVIRRATDDPSSSALIDSIMVRVDDVDSHWARASGRGASVVAPPADQPYGERQYSARDPFGHLRTFSQSIADVAPEDWGGIAGDL